MTLHPTENVGNAGALANAPLRGDLADAWPVSGRDTTA